MVALAGLFQLFEVLVQLLLRGPGRAIDALEHRALLVAAPVGAGDAQQLDRADLARVVNVRPAAEIEERAVAGTC